MGWTASILSAIITKTNFFLFLRFLFYSESDEATFNSFLSNRLWPLRIERRNYDYHIDTCNESSRLCFRMEISG